MIDDLRDILEELYYAPKMDDLNPVAWKNVHINNAIEEVKKWVEKNEKIEIGKALLKELPIIGEKYKGESVDWDSDAGYITRQVRKVVANFFGIKPEKRGGKK